MDEASWPDGMLQLATSLYLDVFLKEASCMVAGGQNCCVSLRLTFAYRIQLYNSI